MAGVEQAIVLVLSVATAAAPAGPAAILRLLAADGAQGLQEASLPSACPVPLRLVGAVRPPPRLPDQTQLVAASPANC